MVLAQKTVDFLNEIAKIDSKALERLIKARVSCNLALADHPTIQASDFRGTPDDPYRVGLLGILNGLCGSYDDGPRKGWGAIGVNVNPGPIEGSIELVDFIIMKNE